MPIETIQYVTSSDHKQEEAQIIINSAKLGDGTAVRDRFAFEYRGASIDERLEVDLATMVQDEVVKAYSNVQLPCIVEHAGLIFEDYEPHGYPGGLTKPMWNTLGDRFLEETASRGRRAIARAVVAYCDGMSVHTFVGEVRGTLSDAPRGSRAFYWDTVFIPDSTGAANGKTYAEIVDDASLGLRYKVLELSQSRAALMQFLEFRHTSPTPRLWR